MTRAGTAGPVSRLASSRRTRGARVERGADDTGAEFDGGHAIASWRDELPEALTALFGGASG